MAADKGRRRKLEVKEEVRLDTSDLILKTLNPKTQKSWNLGN